MPTDNRAAPSADPKYVIVVKDGRGPHVGPFPPLNKHGQPTVFTRAQFVKLHPAPADGLDPHGEIEAADQYHDRLIKQMVDGGVIALLNPVVAVVDRPADPVPVGPENKPAVAKPVVAATVAQTPSAAGAAR